VQIDEKPSSKQLEGVFSAPPRVDERTKTTAKEKTK
jgi:hypothetical protein